MFHNINEFDVYNEPNRLENASPPFFFFFFGLSLAPSFNTASGILLRTVLCLSSFILWSFGGMSDFDFGLFVFFWDDKSSSREIATPISVSEPGASVAIVCVVELSESSLPSPELADFITVVDTDSWS